MTVNLNINGVISGGRMGGRREEVYPAYVLETVRCRKLILGRDIGQGVWVCKVMV